MKKKMLFFVLLILCCLGWLGNFTFYLCTHLIIIFIVIILWDFEVDNKAIEPEFFSSTHNAVPKEYSSFFALACKGLELQGYRLVGTIENRLACEMTLFANTASSKQITCFLFLRMEEYTKEAEEAYLPLIIDRLENTFELINQEKIRLIACVCRQNYVGV